METAPLKSFATWARTSLIREVTARIAVVLAPASPERVEKPRAVGDLERAVRAAGGGDKGKAAVADRVAYTWFNRIIALRFMDANGYTGIGVVSPQAGAATGQPEILAEAKRGNIDATAVGGTTHETVTGLLNGSRRSDDPQGEAYALLIADYCRYWNRAMPFMFEREGDFTELLMPANLLADDSVPSRAVKVLTDDFCQDVEVIGWLYQFYISERKDEVFAGFKKSRKAGAAEIPAATQLFTPDWIVRYLVENSLGRLWMLNRPSSTLLDKMQYYIAPVDIETNFLKITGPEDLKVIDPACGSGHMLTYAFDLLYAIYSEEGYAPAEIPSLILTNNLFGTEIDPRAGALAAFALTMKARAKQRSFFRKRTDPNIMVLSPISFTPSEIEFLVSSEGNRSAESSFWNQFQYADEFGSLIRLPTPESSIPSERLSHLNQQGDLFSGDIIERARRVLEQAQYLSTRYATVVTNPPYMGSGNLSARLSKLLADDYAIGKADLFAAFMLRCRSLTMHNGFIGLMTPFTWMFIGSYTALREDLLRTSSITSLVQLEYSGFDGATVPICTFVLQNSGDSARNGTFIRLSEFRGSANQGPRTLEAISDSSCSWKYRAAAADLAAIPSMPIAYWASQETRRAFADNGSIGDAMFSDGLTKTGDNVRFMRQWWEVSHNRAIDENFYRPCAKGGQARNYYGNTDTLVLWTREARSHYTSDRVARITPKYLWDRAGITWTKISSKGATFRLLRESDIPETAGPALYLREGFPGDVLFALLGLLSSTANWDTLALINPTLNFQTGDVQRLPFDSNTMLPMAQPTRSLVEIATEDWNLVETSADFGHHPFLKSDLQSTSLRFLMTATLDSFAQRTKNYVELQASVDTLAAKALGVSARPRPAGDATLLSNPRYRFPAASAVDAESALKNQLIEELVSYAVGCMFGRYSLDEPGLILADQGSRLQDYLAKVPRPSFTPDDDNVIPIMDGEWFEDDIVARFRVFLRAAFGEQHFEENLRFVTEALGVKDIRDYFVRSFYKDHVQRYKKRPIYWMFSSSKGSFNALIYMHRYTPSTVSRVLNEYLREFRAKLSSSLQHQGQLAVSGGTPRQQAAAQKEADRLRKVLLELEEYEHDVLYPLASRQLVIDLDDGVRANYPRFGAALKKIVGLEVSDE